MSRFEDHLWREFLREHGNDLAQMARPSVKQSRRVSPRVVAGTGLGLVAMGALLALVLGATTTSPAFAVTHNHDGSVTVRVLRTAGIAGANAKLHALGIRATVLPQVPVRCGDLPTAGRGAPAPQGNFSGARWTIDPRRVPAGHTLMLTPPPGSGSNGGNSGNSGNGGNSGTATRGGSQVPVPDGNRGNSGNSGAAGQVSSCPQLNLQGQGKAGSGASDGGN